MSHGFFRHLYDVHDIYGIAKAFQGVNHDGDRIDRFGGETTTGCLNNYRNGMMVSVDEHIQGG